MKLQATKMTPDQVKQDEMRSYNPQIWNSNVDRMVSKYMDVEFYKVDKGNGYDYPRMFVVYTLPEGLRLMSSFDYSGSMTNGGFMEVMINNFEIKFTDNGDLESITHFEDGHCELVTRKFIGAEGKEAMINTTPEARQWMAQQSMQLGMIFTKGL
jgi:hypothetical protein